MESIRQRIASKGPAERVVVALDLPDEAAALRLADSLRPQLSWVKVGLELFGAAGPPVVRKLVSMGFSVFLDLKLHDIPNTVASAVRVLGGMGVELATVHAGGGACVAAAAEAAREAAVNSPHGRPMQILGVTVLTSHGERDLSELYATQLGARELVVRLGSAAIRAGASGLVASPMEIGALRASVGAAPLLVIPGIRPAGAEKGDQARVATPAEAVRAGADLLVIGRPISRADSPRDALARVVDEIAADS